MLTSMSLFLDRVQSTCIGVMCADMCSGAAMQKLGEAESGDLDEDLIPMLTSMSLFLDRDCAYHEHVCISRVPQRVSMQAWRCTCAAHSMACLASCLLCCVSTGAA